MWIVALRKDENLRQIMVAGSDEGRACSQKKATRNLMA
jgi:hypothetical protein